MSEATGGVAPVFRSSPRRAVNNWVGVLLLALLLTAVTAVPALASGSEQGSKTCSIGQVALRGETTGVTNFYVPNDGSPNKTVNHGMALQVSYYVSGYASSSWKVSTNLYLDGPGTYAYCAGI